MQYTVMPAFTHFRQDVVINMNIDRKLPILYTIIGAFICCRRQSLGIVLTFITMATIVFILDTDHTV